MTTPDPAAPVSPEEAPTVAPPPPLNEVLAHAVVVVTGTVLHDGAGRRSLQVADLLRGDRDDLALLARLPLPDVPDGQGDVVLIVGDGTDPGAPAGAPAGPYLLADPAQLDEEQVRRVLAGLPPLPPIDGTPDELAAAADLVLVGGPTGAVRPLPGAGAGGCEPGREQPGGDDGWVEVEVLVREVLSARPGAWDRAGPAGQLVGPGLAVADRPRLWVAVEAGSAERFRRSIPGPWFVALSGDGSGRSLTRSAPEQFLSILRPLRARLRAAPGGAGGGAR